MTGLTLSWDGIPESQREALTRAIDLGYTTIRLVGDVSNKDKSRLRVFVQVQALKKPVITDNGLGEVDNEVWLFADDIAAPWNKVIT